MKSAGGWLAACRRGLEDRGRERDSGKGKDGKGKLLGDWQGVGEDSGRGKGLLGEDSVKGNAGNWKEGFGDSDGKGIQGRKENVRDSQEKGKAGKERKEGFAGKGGSGMKRELQLKGEMEGEDQGVAGIGLKGQQLDLQEQGKGNPQ